MPRYDVEMPNGKIITLEGDTPPTEQELEEIYSTMQPQGVMAGVRGLAGATKAIADPMTTAKDPKASLLLALNLAQFGGQTALPLPWLSGLTTTPATEFAMQKIKGQPTSEALKQAGTAGATDLALTGAGAVIAKLAKLSKPLLRKAVPMMTGISEEATETALRKPEILKGKSNLEKTFNELGKKAQQASEYIKNKAGKAVELEKRIVKNIDKPIDLTDLANKVDDKIVNTWSKSGLVEKLTPEQTKYAENIGNKFRTMSNKSTSADDLLTLRESLDEKINWNRKEGNSAFANLLENVRTDIKNKLIDISPSLNKVNKKYQDVIELNKTLKTKLGKDATAGANLQNTFKKAMNTDEAVAYLDEFKKLDDLAPKNLKFAEKANEALVKKEFNQWKPKKGLLHDIRLSQALLGGAGGYGLATGNAPLAAGAAVLGAASIPRAYKTLITAGVAAKKVAQQPMVQGVTKNLATRVLATRVNELLLNKREEY